MIYARKSAFSLLEIFYGRKPQPFTKRFLRKHLIAEHLKTIWLLMRNSSHNGGKVLSERKDFKILALSPERHLKIKVCCCCCSTAYEISYMEWAFITCFSIVSALVSDLLLLPVDKIFKETVPYASF